MEQYYYNRMNKIEQAVYHALYQGFLNIDEEIQIPRLEGEALYNVFLQAPAGSSGKFFWVNRL